MVDSAFFDNIIDALEAVLALQTTNGTIINQAPLIAQITKLKLYRAKYIKSILDFEQSVGEILNKIEKD